MSVTTSQYPIQNRQTQYVTIYFSGTAGEQTFSINNFFVPDEVKVSCALANYTVFGGGGAITSCNIEPTVYVTNSAIDNTFYPSNVFEVRSNFSPNSILGIVNANNSLNSSMTFVNSSRTNMSGNYTVNAFNLINQEPITLGTLILTFEFIRYK